MLARAFVWGCRPKAEMGTDFNSLNPYNMPSTVLLENREMRGSGDPLKFTEQVPGESWAQQKTGPEPSSVPWGHRQMAGWRNYSFCSES